MRNLLAGKNFTEAAVQAGYSPETVDKRGTKLLRAEHWAVLLQEAKLDDPTLAQRLHELVHAKSTRFFAHEGRVKDRRVVIDWDARAKGLDMAARIRGAYARPNEAPEDMPGPVVNVQINVIKGPPAAVRADGDGEPVMGGLVIRRRPPGNGEEPR